MPPGTAPGVASKARARQVISDFSTAHDCDIVCFRDKIEHYTADDIAEVFRDRQDKKPNLALILTTYGGNPDAAYRIGRAIQNNYKGEKNLLYIWFMQKCRNANFASC